MRVGLHDSDKAHLKGDKAPYPNLALMKLAAWHKSRGDTVEWFMPLVAYDVVYSSKIFSWTQEDSYLPGNTIRGGTGYGLYDSLPAQIDAMRPDYSLYGVAYGMGFLTRGCIRACPWCVVPKKEGNIRRNADIEDLTNGHSKKVVLMDNNVLACAHGIRQIMKAGRLGLQVDFNQGLDARLIDSSIARKLAKLKWLSPLRLACDHKSQMPEIERAVKLLRAAGVKPARYSCYVLVKDVADALERVEFLRGLDISPFAQPYRDHQNTPITQEQRHFARWVNIKKLFRTVCWEQEKRHLEAQQAALPGV